MKQNPKKVKITNLNAPIPEFKGKDIEGTTYRDIFISLSTEDQIEWLVSLIEDSNEQIFRLQQQVDYLQDETGLSVNEVEVLQRKDVWTKSEVEAYFKVDEKTLRKGAESGEWPVPIKRGKKIYYKLWDLKEVFRSKDGNLDKLDNYLSQ